jgi:hypothetical protein
MPSALKERNITWALSEKTTFRFTFIYFGLFIILQKNGFNSIKK